MKRLIRLVAMSCALFLLLAVGSCKDADGPKIEQWDGPPSPMIESVFGVVDCPEPFPSSLVAQGVPLELRETIDGKTRSYGDPRPVETGRFGARPTGYKQRFMTLFRADLPRDDPRYAYIIVSRDGPDPLLYQPCDSGEDEP